MFRASGAFSLSDIILITIAVSLIMVPVKAQSIAYADGQSHDVTSSSYAIALGNGPEGVTTTLNVRAGGSVVSLDSRAINSSGASVINIVGGMVNGHVGGYFYDSSVVNLTGGTLSGDIVGAYFFNSSVANLEGGLLSGLYVGIYAYDSSTVALRGAAIDSRIGMYINGDSTLSINSGDIYASYGVYGMDRSVIDISAGFFHSASYAGFTAGVAVCAYGDATVRISGGIFDASRSLTISQNASVRISGGQFIYSAADYRPIIDGYSSKPLYFYGSDFTINGNRVPYGTAYYSEFSELRGTLADGNALAVGLPYPNTFVFIESFIPEYSLFTSVVGGLALLLAGCGKWRLEADEGSKQERRKSRNR